MMQVLEYPLLNVVACPDDDNVFIWHGNGNHFVFGNTGTCARWSLGDSLDVAYVHIEEVHSPASDHLRF